MFKPKKGKLAYKLIVSYFINHIVLALCILLIAGKALSIIEEQFFEKYKSSVIEYVASLDIEMMQLKTILSHAMQDENVLMLRERKEQLSLYDLIQYKLKVKENLTVIANQYSLIDDIGIYIPEYDQWIDVETWFADKEAPQISTSSYHLEVREEALFLIADTKRRGGGV